MFNFAIIISAILLFILLRVIDTLLDRTIDAEREQAVTEEHLEYLKAVFAQAMQRPANISSDQMAMIMQMVNSTKESN